ncbi:MED6 mediator sub complex component-domain-containing protein [Lineolata rhizophorae]|uniref:Mediator of RNA polymerase II transcription subunit 6 n=1 Tax=Lineolata rhizophorae TaxID=578093 RepID=A0A6A6NSE9_9PEZI|nr:MED6 mediator sub complex component-domain-containing protein [Lineolata rhizophorae]
MATDAEEPALDEIQWRSPHLVEFFQGIHSDTVMLYFMESPFFDRTSNNWAIRSQAQFNESMQHLLASREAFETRLREMPGLEFMVVAEPQPAPGGDNGIWIIRKQQRRKRGPGLDDRITVLGTYFVIGENIYQAPSTEDVIGSKILSAATALTKFLSTASSLPLFSPAQGYSYLPPTTKSSTAPFSARESRAGSPMQLDSSQAPPLPSSQQSAGASGTAGAGKPSAASASSALSAAAQNERALFESFNLSIRYGAEYMDENPLLGEPGSFVFSATNERVQARSQQQQQQTTLSQSQTDVQPSQSFRSGSAVPSSQAQGQGAAVNRGPGEKSPTTPSAGSPPAGVKKVRRKSKALVSPMSPSGA